MTMNVIIRADASTAIGTGHIMRCLTLADGLRATGAQSAFVCRAEQGNLISLVEERGYPVHRLPSGISSPEDRDMTRSLLENSGKAVDWLIVDHYGLDKAYESALRSVTKRIMVIDDLADRTHDCDLLLDQNYGGPDDRYDGLVPPSCRKALGTSYALVRSEFIQAREAAGVRRGPVFKVLVFLGGSDRTNETAKVLSAFEQLKRRDIALDVVIGPTNDHRDEIERLASRISASRCHVNAPSLALLMGAADLAVGAGGSSMWERCCAGLPTLAVTVADNQAALTEALAHDGYIIFAGPGSSVTVDTLRRDLEFLIAHPEVIRRLSERCLDLVDGKGVDRIVHLITAAERQMVLRPAEERDGRTVFDWRNHPAVISASFDHRPLQWYTHQQWFALALQAEDRTLLIAESSGKPVGVLRYDFQGVEAVVSIYLDPEHIGAGIGPEILKMGTELVRMNRPSVQRIIARVMPGNEASAGAFRKAGFQEHYRSFQLEL